MSDILTAILDGESKIKIINPVTGATKQEVTLNGRVINGPIVVGDQCTATIEYNNKKEAIVFSLATGATINTFQIN